VAVEFNEVGTAAVDGQVFTFGTVMRGLEGVVLAHSGMFAVVIKS